MNKTVIFPLEREEKAIYMGWERDISLKRDALRLSEMPKNPNLANEELPRGPYPVARWTSLGATWKRDRSEAFLKHSVQISLKRDDVASSKMLHSHERSESEIKARQSWSIMLTFFEHKHSPNYLKWLTMIWY